MDGFCRTELWDLNTTWHAETPDFTPCFHETVLVWLPCAFLWLVSPYEIYKIRTSAVKANRIPWTLLSLMKVLFAISLAFLSSLELIDALVNLSERNPVDYYTPFVKLVTFVYVSILISLNRKKAIQSSGTLFLFWLLLSIGSITTYRSILSDLLNPSSLSWSLHPLLYAIKIIGVPLIFAEWVLSCFADSLPLAYIAPGQDINNPSPEWSASFMSLLTYAWFDGLIKKGYKKPLVLDDMYDLSKENKSADVFERFCKYWSYPASPRIFGPLARTFWMPLLGSSLLKLISSLLTFVSPQVLDYLLVWLAGDGPYWRGFFFAAIMFVSALMESMLNNQYEYIMACTAMQMKTAVISALHRKALVLSPTAKAEYTTGQIVNLMSVDTQRIVDFIAFANFIWIAPLQLSIAIYLLWQQLGVASIAGLMVMVLLVPINGYITSKYRKTATILMKEKDKRSKIMNEIVNGIKVLKMYAWENSFVKQVKRIRDKEVQELRVQTSYMVWITFTIGCAPIFVALSSFVTFTFIDEKNILDPSKAFVSLSLFNIVRAPLAMVPFVVTFAAMFVVAKTRIDSFLSCGEMNPDDVGRKENGDKAIEVVDGEFAWGSKGDSALRDVNLTIKRNKLVAVVGTVGSGKSSLLAALLGDMYKVKGGVNLAGKVAYVPQQAWIQNATLKNNIVFMGALDPTKYDTVLETCALKPDLKILAAGDQTEIGEKGINLSGGQKQRVSLARAVYADCDIYLLDDPLSAVDSHVGKHIFDQVIGPKGMLKNTTRVLVTHKVALLPHVDEIVVMKDGQISEHGSYLELLQRKGAFADFLVEYLAEEQEDDETLEEIKELIRPELERHMSKVSEVSSEKASVLRRSMSVVSETRSRKDTGRTQSSGAQGKKKSTQGPPAGRLIGEEAAQTGSVKWNVYADYVKAIGLSSCLAILAANVISNGFNVASSLWLTAWSDDALYEERVNDKKLRNIRLGVYGAFGLSEAICLFVANTITFYGTLKASALIHDMMLDRIFRAPMSFYDTTPLGRILNRFTKDIDNADIAIRMNIRQFLSSFFKTIVTFLIICFQTPYFLLPLIPMGFIYYVVQRYYIMTSRQLRRLESNSKSPVYSHFGETVSGATCIRAFQMEKEFNLECDRKNDVNNACYVLSLAAARWLAVRLEFLGNTIVLFASLFGVFSRGEIEPSTVGLSLSYALTATVTLNMLVKASADLENSLVAIERCLEYTKTPTEAALEIVSTKPKPSWPEKGVIEFKDYAARYRDGLELVLKNVNFEVNAGEKVGIVGRTGAGKSSLTVALFRIVEPANGTIVIDDVDVTRIGLHSLRAGLTIIPQDPVLFTGSLRLNLDPFNEHNDDELWTALKLSHLEQFVETVGKGLEYDIAEGGDNLSVGQRQLVCLARALLRKSKILILDEATAAVDLETDDLIQKTIRTEFSDCTILTIAHRLNTILDYDRVLVMDKGMVSEFDTPKALMENESSIFHSMAKDAGLIASGGNEDDANE